MLWNIFLVENFIFLKSHQNVRLFPRILVRVIGLEVKLFRNQFTFIKLVLTCHHSAGKHDCMDLYTRNIFLHNFHLYSLKVVQLVQIQFKIFQLNCKDNKKKNRRC